jgi:signal transduction histidine kinase
VKIHTRTLVILGATIFSLIIILAIVAHFFVLSSYAQVEQQESATNVALATDQIQSETGDLGESIHSWAVSDSTYRFVQDKNSDYIRSVLDPSAFHEGLGIDGVLYYNTTGDLVYSRGFEGQDQKTGTIVPELASYVDNHRDVLPNASGVKRKQGFILLPHGPVIVAMHAILPVSGSTQGIGKGTMVVVRSFDSAEVAALQEKVHLPVRISTLDSPDVAGSAEISELTGAGAPLVISHVLNQTTITGSTLVNGIDGQPVLLLEVQTPRHMNTQASASLIFILSAFLVIGVIYVIVTELLLRRYIIRHLTGLDTTMKEIGDRRDLSERIPVNGDDEIASLKQSLNSMLQELEEKEEKLAEAHRKANMYLDIYLDVLTYEILNAAMAQRGYAELILESEGKDKEMYVSRIIDIINRNREVIKNIETISAIYKHPPSKAPTDLGDLLTRITRDYPKIAITCKDDNISVLADEKLEIVFRNIIDNSIKYGGNEVQIAISAKSTENGMIEISVTDTGKGIPDSMKPQIFDRFTKGSEKRSSYGLGLHIVKMLIEAYGGRIWADDRVAGHPDGGAAIRFTLFTT